MYEYNMQHLGREDRGFNVQILGKTRGATAVTASRYPSIAKDAPANGACEPTGNHTASKRFLL